MLPTLAWENNWDDRRQASRKFPVASGQQAVARIEVHMQLLWGIKVTSDARFASWSDKSYIV